MSLKDIPAFRRDPKGYLASIPVPKKIPQEENDILKTFGECLNPYSKYF